MPLEWTIEKGLGTKVAVSWRQPYKRSRIPCIFQMVFYLKVKQNQNKIFLRIHQKLKRRKSIPKMINKNYYIITFLYFDIIPKWSHQ